MLEAEAVLVRHLGADAELVIAARLNRATVLAELGPLADAAGLAEPAYAQAQRSLGAETSTVRNGLRVLGQIRRAQGRQDESVRLFEQLVDSERRSVGDDSVPAALARVHLARALAARDGDGDAVRACDLLDLAIPILAQPGRNPLLLANALLDRADLLARSDHEAAAADRAAARRTTVDIAVLPLSILRRLEGN